LSKASSSSNAEASPFRQHLKPVEQTAAEALLHTESRRLGRTEQSLIRIREAAAAEGFEQGKLEGLAIGKEQGMIAATEACQEHVENFGRALETAAERVEQAMDDWYRRAEDQLASLSIEIAAQILGRECQLDREAVLPIVREAIHQVALADSVRIRISPFDVPLVKEHETEILAYAPSVKKVEIVSDPKIEGGCMIESDAGVIDATIRTKLDLILETMREAA